MRYTCPQCQGHELTKKDGSDRLNATIFAITGERERVMAAGYTGYLEKPIDPETFVDEAMSFP